MFVCFDIESTGLSTTSCDIIQFAYCLFDNNNQFVRAENLYFYYDGMSWSQEAADASHQLSLEFLRQYKDDFEKNLLKMYALLNRCNVIGHNSDGFDCPFVKNWLSRMGLDDFQFGIQQDTMKAFKPITKKARIKLTKLTEMMGISKQSVNYFASLWFGNDHIRGPHDAAYDVTATAMLTLMGIGKNLINFNPIMVAPVTSEDEFLSLDDEYMADSKPIDPNGFILNLSDDGETWYKYWLNHDRDVYRELEVLTGDDELVYVTSNPYVNVPLLLDGDIYRGEHKGVVYTFRKGDEEHLTVSSPYVTFKDTDIDFSNFIKHNFGMEE